MKVIFKYDMDAGIVKGVMYENEDGQAAGKVMRNDGSIHDMSTLGRSVKGKPASFSLYDAFIERGGAYNPLYPAEVDDLRTAFKYLGKSVDLVKTLPEVFFDDESSTGAVE